MDRQILLNSIIKGLKKAIDDMFHFTDNEAARVNAEYLVTVNIAQAFREVFAGIDSPYKIYLEKNKGNFSRDCVPAVKWGDYRRRTSTVFRSRNKPKNQERIDIVVYQCRSLDDPVGYLTDFPVCAIEVKGVKAQKCNVVKDLERNLEYFSLSDATGPSSIEHALFVAINQISVSRVKSEAHGEEVTKNKYEGYLSELADMASVNKEVKTFTLSYEPHGRVEDYIDDTPVIDTSYRHYFCGVIVCFSKKNASSNV